MPRRNDMQVLKGDVFYIEKTNNTYGSEQQAGRPAIIVSNDIGNEHSENVSIVYLTTREKKPLPTHVQVKANVISTALCEQIYTVSKDRLGNYIRSLTEEEMAAIEDAILVGLGIEPKSNIVMENALKLTCEKLKKELDEARYEISVLQRADKVTYINDVKSDEVLKLEVERDIYKKQYEELFERVIRKAVQV